jgi:hypothetical protein
MMRWLVVSLLLLGGTPSTSTAGQIEVKVDGETVWLLADAAPLCDVLDELARKTELRVTLEIACDALVSLSASDSLRGVLAELLQGRSYAFVESSGQRLLTVFSPPAEERQTDDAERAAAEAEELPHEPARLLNDEHEPATPSARGGDDDDTPLSPLDTFVGTPKVVLADEVPPGGPTQRAPRTGPTDAELDAGAR